MHISRAVLWTAAAFCIVAVAGASWSSLRMDSARAKPTALETFLARHARRLATEPGARSLRNLLSPTSLNVVEARDHFADHCAIRHANITAVAKPKSTPASIPCAGLAKVRNSGPRL